MKHLIRLFYTAFILIPAWRSRRLARAFERLGPSFIKLGQTLSTRADLLGEATATDLATLRDRLPPFSAQAARRIVEEELGASPETLFAAFDPAPVAAASIAQVHKARTHDGREVAVKILRPGIEKAFARDLRFFAWLARLLEKRVPAARRLKPVEVVAMLRDAVSLELDLRFEAAALTEMAGNIRPGEGFRVPQVEWNLTARRVLVTEWIHGIPIHDGDALRAAGHDIDAVLGRLAGAFFNQVFRDGFFHADLHPGNLFVEADGTVTAVDFGIMGRMSERERIYMAEIFRGFLNEDYLHVAHMHFRAGYVPAHHSVEQFAQACMAIAKPILNRPANEISLAALLAQLFKITERFDMQTQPQLLLFQRNMMVVEGVGRLLDPTVNMWELARAPIEAWARETLSPAARLRHLAGLLSEFLRDLPEALEEMLRKG